MRHWLGLFKTPISLEEKTVMRLFCSTKKKLKQTRQPKAGCAQKEKSHIALSQEYFGGNWLCLKMTDTFFGRKTGAVTTQVLPLDVRVAVFSILAPSTEALQKPRRPAAQCPLLVDQGGQSMDVHWSFNLSMGLTSFKVQSEGKD